MFDAVFFFTGVATYVVLVVWLIHKMPGEWKSTASLIATLLSLALYLYLDKSPQVTIFEDDHRVVDSLKVSENSILDSLRASENRVMGLIQINEGRLGGTIETLQDSVRALQKGVHALQESVRVHPDRHLHIIDAKLDTLRDLYKVTRE